MDFYYQRHMHMSNFPNFISVVTLGGKKVEYEQCEKGTVPQVPGNAVLPRCEGCQILPLVDSCLRVY